MKAEDILVKLRELAPSVCFNVDFEEDPDFAWDGDGPDPIDGGLVAHDAQVSAGTICGGVMLTGFTNICGVYLEPYEYDLDIHGYLPQMLREAAQDLLATIKSKGIVGSRITIELQFIIEFLTRELKDRYDEQRASING